MSPWKDKDIRRMFMGENVASSNDRSDAEMKEFDRWLVAHDKRVAKKTEQRIIKLLEDKRSEIEKIVTMSDELGETSSKWFYQDRIRELSDYIALIKGEK